MAVPECPVCYHVFACQILRDYFFTFYFGGVLTLNAIIMFFFAFSSSTFGAINQHDKLAKTMTYFLDHPVYLVAGPILL